MATPRTMAAQQQQCLACGGEAGTNVCGKCQTAPYCSAACIASDWSKHKPDCQDARLRQAAMDLMRREVAWLQSLPVEARMRLVGAVDYLELFRYNHHLTFMAYALVLSGVLPCHYHDVGEGRDWASYTEQFSKKVLRPWFTKHQRFLEMKGFRLHFFEEPLECCPCEELPRLNVEGCQNQVVLQPGPFFWNKKHPEAAVTKHIFFESEETDASLDHARDGRFEVLRCLGMTASSYAAAIQPDVVPVNFDLLDPKTFLGDDGACCSGWMIRPVDSATAGEAGEFFAICEEALARFDIPIKFDICAANIEDHNVNLTAEGYARLVVGAARGDRARATDFFNSLSSKATLGRRKIKQIMQLIREYSQQEV